MCGIVGYFDKSGRVDAPLGATVRNMLESLACRGPDSAGVALFGKPSPGHLHAQIKVAGHTDQITALAEKFGASDLTQRGAYLRCAIRDSDEWTALIASVESLDRDVEVVSVGRRLEIVKQVGSPANLDAAFAISDFRGSHGLGHTRLSTESIVDLSHSQPFWSHGYPDLAIVHNGHITNYHLLRRRYEQRGVRFYTENDSEIIAIYLAMQLSRGADLRKALSGMLTDLDGSFSCLAATESEFGFVKDPFSFKPLVFAESNGFVAVATEEIAIRGALAGEYDVCEAQAGEVRVWRR